MCYIRQETRVLKVLDASFPRKTTNFLTHPRHDADDGLRLPEEGDGVEGSSGFPCSVRLHPLHGPDSGVRVPSSPSLLQRHRLRGAPGRGISLDLLPLLWLPQHGWMAASARKLVRAISLLF